LYEETVKLEVMSFCKTIINFFRVSVIVKYGLDASPSLFTITIIGGLTTKHSHHLIGKAISRLVSLWMGDQ
jgi:hypothetical protein